ncbi:unnamed protein product [Urochloa decumbens]|uniref:Uncharacterized protein n=1 Tax=Urochloa decumbens TaxID=240449 RepID=A0ABC9BAV0_9POAL
MMPSALSSTFPFPKENPIPHSPASRKPARLLGRRLFPVRSVAAAAPTAGRLRKIRPPSLSSMPLRTPTPTTISTSTPGTARGRHVFEINGYSKHRGMGSPDENFVRSGTFSVGGYYWSIRFYPDGNTVKEKDYISVYLELMRDGAKVRASCDLRLVDQTTGLPSSVHTTELRMFSSSDASRYAPQTSLFKKRSELEDSGYLKDDRLVIDCVITVVTELRVSESKFRRRIEVPPSDIGKCLGKLLDAEEGADVTFSVGGETLAAHKLVLAMRSPVFKAELYGPMREGSAKLVTIEDMQPAVFRALLHFIYTDSLPDMDDLGQDANCEMMRHLLVAANRYGVDRLKLVCQSIMCDKIDVKNVATTLGLAYQHDCNLLYDVCLEYISSSNVMDAVVATHGYKNLKTTCPSALADALEKSVTLHKA